MGLKPRNYVVTISLLVLFLVSNSTNALTQVKSLQDNSDWWSLARRDSYDIKESAKSEKIMDGNFQIAGVALGSNQFDLLYKNGSAITIQRGDGAFGRQQVCYVRSKGKKSKHLIFEHNEINETFYLFSGGADWKGQADCAKTSGTSWVTPTGLRLGIKQSKVEAILGKPDAVEKDRILYLRETKQKASDDQFAELRKTSPKSSDEDAHAMFDYFYLTQYIEARFTDSKLTYLAVSQAETD